MASTLLYLLKPFGADPRRPRLQRVASLPALLVRAVIGCAIVVIVFWWWTAHQALEANNNDKVFGLDQLAVTVPIGQTVEIGRVALIQPRGGDSAEARHIAIEHRALPQGASGVFIRNVADERRLSLQFGRGTAAPSSGAAERFPLAPDKTSTVTVARATLTFSDITRSGFDLRLTQGGTTRQFRLSLSGAEENLAAVKTGAVEPPQPGICRAPEGLERISEFALRWILPIFPRLGPDERRVLMIGGEYTCRDQRTWQIGAAPGIGWRQLAVTYRWREQRFYLVPVEARRRNHLLIAFDGPQGHAAGFGGLSWRLDAPDELGHGAVTGFVAGRASYAVTTTIAGQGRTRVASVRIAAREKIPLFSESDCGWLRRDSTKPAGDVEGCPDVLAKPATGSLSWKPSEPFHVLARYLGRDTSLVLSRGESVWRLTVAMLALLLIVWFTRLPSAIRGLLGSRSPLPGARIGRGLIALALTLAACALALAPEIAELLNLRWFDGRWAFAATLLNWLLAGLALLLAEAGIVLGLFWAVFTVIAGIGAISMASMALDGDNTHWVAYFAKHKLLFLDLLPPFVVAVASAPIYALRPVVEELVVGNRATSSQGLLRWTFYFLVRWAPVGLIAGAFLAWLLIGGQQGVAGIQPVEAGKFAVLAICGVLLMAMTRTSRTLSIRRRGGAKLLSLIVLLLFTALLFFSPILRSDYSPTLIVLLLTGGLVVLRIMPAAFAWMSQRLGEYVERRRIPMRFRPRVDHRLLFFLARPRISRGWILCAAVVLGVVLSVPATLIMATNATNLMSQFLDLDPPYWPETRTEQLDALQKALGRGRRVPVERILTWIDLGYPVRDTAAANGETLDVARFRDIGFQLIRSRVVIANADCRASDDMIPDGSNWVGRAGAWLMRHLEDAFGFARGHKTLCTSLMARGTDTQKDPETGARARRALLDPAEPIRVPVVQNDFAAAYLIGRHGADAAALLMTMQGALLLIVIYGYRRLRQTSEQQSAEGLVRQLLAVLIVGTGMLLLLHWTISWSNVLGLLPVMGQPMTFLSAGTSHHQLMALPCLITIILALRYTAHRPRIVAYRSPPPYP